MTEPRVPTLAIDDELKRKLLFTLLALVIYRIGAHIPAPGVTVTAPADFNRNSGPPRFLGLFSPPGGGPRGGAGVVGGRGGLGRLTPGGGCGRPDP